MLGYIKGLARRRKLILILILGVTGLLFLETRLDSIFYNMKTILEERIGNAISCNVKIQDIDGGIIRPLILKDVTLNALDSGFFDSLSAKRLVVDARLIDLVLRKDKLLNRIYISGADVYIKKIPAGDPNQNNILPLKLPYDISVYLKDASIFTGYESPSLITDMDTELRLSRQEIVFKNLKAAILSLRFFGNGKFYLNSSQPSISAKLKFYPDSVEDLLSRIPFASEQPIKNFYLDIKGSLSKPHIWGSIGIFNNLKIRFAGNVFIEQDGLGIENFSIMDKFLIKGKVDNVNKTAFMEILPKQGRILVHCAFGNLPDFLVSSKISHVDIKNFDVSINQILIKGKFYNVAGSQIKGVDMDVTTLGSIVDLRPFFDIDASIQLKEDVLDIIYVKLGDNYLWNGTFKISKPTFLDLYCSIKDADVTELMMLLTKVSEESSFSGVANGSLDLKGPFPNIETKGHLEIKDGSIGDITYQTMNVNLRGEGPIIRIFDSRMYRQEGFFELEGNVDIRKIGDAKFCEDLTVYSDQKTIVWAGWDITKDYKSPQLKMGKDVGKDFRVSFKTYMNDEISVKDEDKNQEVELEYKMRDKASSLKMRTGVDEEFFGLERKHRF